jgi:transcriptional regulator with XRE-family HTH domain
MQHLSQRIDMTGFVGSCVEANGYTRRVERWRKVLVDAWEQSRLTLDELADRSKLNRGTIHRILDDKTNEPSFNTVVKLAAAFGPDVTHEMARLINPRPDQESGHAERRAGSPVLEALLAHLDEEAPAEDSVRGDILKAIAALNRALRRDADTGAPPAATRKIGS